MFIIILLFIFVLQSCGKKADEKIINSKDNIEDNIYSNLSDNEFNINNFDNNEIPLVLVEKISRLTNYQKESIGLTQAKVIITYNQNIHDILVVNDEEKHLITRSTSSLVKVFLEAYFNNNMVSYREKESDEFVDVTLEEYLNIYGTTPLEKTLEGFVLSKDNIISVEKMDCSDDGLYGYRITINGEVGSAGIKTQMKKCGNLDDYPEFSSVIFTITIKEDFTPVKIIQESDYIVKYPVLGKCNCHQNIEITYTFQK